MKIMANVKEITSLMSEAQRSVTILWLTAANMIDEGTKTITSRRRASSVDFALLPRDWSMMAADFIKHVRMIPLKKMRMQSRAYSVYSGMLFFPKTEITRSGASSKIKKKTVPTPRTIFVMVRTVSFTRSVFPAPILNPIIGWPPRLIPITIETTMPNTFITIPTTARGITEPNATPVLAKVS